MAPVYEIKTRHIGYFSHISLVIKDCKSNILLDFFTYTKNAINEWIVTAIRHGKPMAAEKYDIDIPITGKK